MGSRGPVGKRSDQRHGHRTEAEQARTEKATVRGEVKPPATPKGLHPIARRWFESLKKSGQSRFYEPSDWATALLIAESISRDLRPQVVGIAQKDGAPVVAAIPLKGTSLAAYLKAMTNLLVTEGDRRRVHLELERESAAPQEDPAVTALDDYRNRASG